MMRGGIEKKPCPACWKGVLYSTGIRQRKYPHKLFYQCSFCGRTMTMLKHGKLMEHMKRPGMAAKKPNKGAVFEKNGPPKAMIPHPGFVVGVARDARTGKPIDMAHVCLRGRGVEAFTNRFGQYALEPVPEHRAVEIEFSSPGHAKKLRVCKYGVKDSEIRRLDISLHPTRQIQKPASLKRAALELKYIRSGQMKAFPGGIEGVVRDIHGNPIFAALVTVFHHEKIMMAQTDTVGHYELINALPHGDYMARAAAYGYSFDRKWVRMSKGRVARCDFVLAERRTVRA